MARTPINAISFSGTQVSLKYASLSTPLLGVRTRVAYFTDYTPVHEPHDCTDVSAKIFKNPGEFSGSTTEVDFCPACSTTVKI